MSEMGFFSVLQKSIPLQVPTCHNNLTWFLWPLGWKPCIYFYLRSAHSINWALVTYSSINRTTPGFGDDLLPARRQGIAWINDHYNDVIMSAMESQITSLMIVYSTVYSDADQRKHKSSVSLAFVRGIPRWPVNSPYKGPVTWKMFPFDEVIMMTDCVLDP